jgi:lipopolysaccharide export LptBFGC system permease protein LptF
MKPSELFALVLRIVGVLCLVYLVRNLMNNWIDGVFPKELAYFLSRIIYLAVGVYLLRGAPHFVRFAYPEERKSSVPATPQ